jgi:hypothetical protein
MLRLLLTAILAITSAQVLAADPKGRVVADVTSFHKNEFHYFALSPDRRNIFVVVAREASAADPHRETSLKIFDVSVPNSPRRIAKLKIGGFASPQMIAGGSRLFISELGEGLRSWVNIVDVQDPRAPKLIARLAIHGFSFDVADDGAA